MEPTHLMIVESFLAGRTAVYVPVIMIRERHYGQFALVELPVESLAVMNAHRSRCEAKRVDTRYVVDRVRLSEISQR